MSDDKFDVYFSTGGTGGQYDFDPEILNHYKIISNLQKLKNMRESVVRGMKKQEFDYFHSFVPTHLSPLIKDWEGPYPDLRKMFRRDQMDWLLAECMNSKDVVDFVIKTGYKDEPKLDQDGKPFLHRTTAVHAVIHSSCYRDFVSDLFKIYDRFDVNCTDESGLTHFHVACQYDCEDEVKKFLELGQDPNLLVPETGDSPLHVAVKHDSSSVIEVLLKSGANPNLIDKEGYTPMEWICSHGDDDDELAKRFFELCDEIQQPVQVNYPDRWGDTLLHTTLERGCVKLTELLLRRDADPNFANENGSTPLHAICRGYGDEDKDSTKKFFEICEEKHQRLQVNAQNDSGNTALHLALDWDKRYTVELLLRKGANPNIANAEGCTALHFMCNDKSSNDRDWAETLFKIIEEEQQTVQVNAQNELGNTALHLTVYYGWKNLMEFLLRNGADSNVANKGGSIPLHILCNNYNRDNELLKLFFKINDEVSQTVQIDAKDKLGMTPLQWAVANLLPDCIDTLFEHGADLSSFVFPTESHFDDAIQKLHGKNWFNFKLKLASGVLAVAECLEKRGYELDRGDATTIMNVFGEWKLYEKPEDVKSRWYDNERFAKEAKKIMIVPMVLYDLIQSRPKEAAKRLKYSDYDELACSRISCNLPKEFKEVCELHLCAKLSRGFFHSWAMDPFMELTRYRLPILCCDRIVEQLSNEDLWRICLAANAGPSSAQSVNQSQ